MERVCQKTSRFLTGKEFSQQRLTFNSLCRELHSLEEQTAALHAEHRQSMHAEHIVSDLQQRFDDVLANLESVAGWKTARINRPVQILESLDGIETGIRQLVRKTPLETTTVQVGSLSITLPTEAEMLRIKAVLVLGRMSSVRRSDPGSSVFVTHLFRSLSATSFA